MRAIDRRFFKKTSIAFFNYHTNKPRYDLFRVIEITRLNFGKSSSIFVGIEHLVKMSNNQHRIKETKIGTKAEISSVTNKLFLLYMALICGNSRNLQIDWYTE